MEFRIVVKTASDFSLEMTMSGGVTKELMDAMVAGIKASKDSIVEHTDFDTMKKVQEPATDAWLEVRDYKWRRL
jgi:hypothetical protein